jgi:hypothetical protein
MKALEPILNLIEGQIIHTTSAENFRKIVQSGVVQAGANHNPGGFCQCAGGISQHTGRPCLSLSDLSLSSREVLLSEESNWYCQLTRPWGATIWRPAVEFEYAEAVPTIVFHRHAIDASRAYSNARILKELPHLTHSDGKFVCVGRFIAEAEICYDATLPVDAIAAVLFICSFDMSDHHYVEWSTAQTVLETMDRFESRIHEQYPPKKHLCPRPVTQSE